MLPVSFDDNSPFVVVADDRQGFHLLLARKEWRGVQIPFEPLWVFECGDRRSFDAAAHWCSVRRNLWDAWGQMANRDGRDALFEHIEELMSAQPIGEVVSVIVRADSDPKAIQLGEHIATAAGLYQSMLYKHRFSTTGKRRRFLDWFAQYAANGSIERLLATAIAHGTGAIAPILEDLADGKPLSKAA